MANPTVLKDPQAAVPVHGIIRLAQIQEGPVEGALLKKSQLLGEFGLRMPVPHPLFCLKSWRAP